MLKKTARPGLPEQWMKLLIGRKKSCQENIYGGVIFLSVSRSKLLFSKRGEIMAIFSGFNNQSSYLGAWGYLQKSNFNEIWPQKVHNWFSICKLM
ncbi:MAG TPA: hypothetical protein P5294_05990 [Smithellaceae bacterium]|nr:hypothetical protein [Smithellaceae bacterium]HRS89869.1 hypothetical protein [Smithellaceae bacterium]HRV26067.1 hypothetical protein [Smithellaceae bacterium]